MVCGLLFVKPAICNLINYKLNLKPDTSHLKPINNITRFEISNLKS